MYNSIFHTHENVDNLPQKGEVFSIKWN